MRKANRVPLDRFLRGGWSLGKRRRQCERGVITLPAPLQTQLSLWLAHRTLVQVAGGGVRGGCADGRIQGQLLTIHLQPPGLWLRPSLSSWSPGKELEVCQVALGKVTWPGCFLPLSGCTDFLGRGVSGARGA